MTKPATYLTRRTSRGIIESEPTQRGGPALPQTDYDICLMLTRLFLGREDTLVAWNLYSTYRLKHPTRDEEEQNDDTRIEAERQS